jgi:hypothetical protein
MRNRPSTEPTTLAGAIAVLDHVGQDSFIGEADEAADETLLLIEHTRGTPLQEAAHAFPRCIAMIMRRLMAERS